ncbi:MAG: DUF4349 domain-containing protein [Candidatus Nanopelagicales bacterium]
MSTITTASRGARRRTVVASAALALAVLGLAGCGAAASGSSGAAGGGAAAVVDGAVAPQPAYAGQERTTGSGTASTVKDAAGGEVGTATTVDRSVVVTADTAVRVDDAQEALTRLGAVAARYGATIADQVSSRGDGTPVPPCVDGGSCPKTVEPTGYESSTTTLRLANDKVDALLRDVAALGTVETSSRSSADVSAEVADVDARVRTAEASLARVRALMGKATSIGDIVALEGELSRRQADLEALQARQRTLADQTAQATVTVRLYDESAPAPVEERTGFLAGLAAGWDAFTGAMVAALTVLGALVPFLIVLVPAGLLVRVLVRRSRRTADAGPVAVPADVTT